MSKRWLLKLLLIAAPFVIGSLIGTAAQSATDQRYLTMIKPSWNPPPWIFGPMWSFLYLLMGWASWRIWKRGSEIHQSTFWPLLSYFLQLMLNFAWTPLFFLLHRPLWALLDIGALVCMIALTINCFARFDKLASYLLMPYLVWTAFAALLNLRLVQLNG